MISLNINRSLRGEDLFADSLASSPAVTPQRARPAENDQEDALKKVEDAQANASRTTFRMMDRHNDMVKKSQELSKVRSRQKAIEDRNRQNREKQTELLTQMAIENAERSKWLNHSSWKQRQQTLAAS